MACAEFEERLLEYAELKNGERARVEAHTAYCSTCREFLEALRTVDSQLTAQLAGLEVTPAFAPAVRRRVRYEGFAARPSVVPELLDFVGWGGDRRAPRFDRVVAGASRAHLQHTTGRFFQCPVCRGRRFSPRGASVWNPFFRRLETVGPPLPV